METKCCGRCKEEKPLSEFNKNKSKPDGLQNYCRTCQREYEKAHYNKKDGIRKRNVSRRRHTYRVRNKTWLKAYFKEHPCVDCGETDPVVLEFDHTDPTDKEESVSNLLGGSLERLIKEVEKCEVRCANCHRRKHYSDSWKDI